MLGSLNLIILIFTFGCFAIVLFKMCENGHQILAAVCFFVCGFGGLIAFVFGWINAREWEIQPIMIGRSACLGLNLVLAVLDVALS